MAHDVFISYSSKDKMVADAACAMLESRGIRCWIAPRDVLPGREWGGSIIDAIEESRAMLLIFSSNSNQSKQIMREVNHAIDRNVSVVPLRIEDVFPSKTMEFYLDVTHWLDAITPPMEDRLREMVDKVSVLLSQPPREEGVSSGRRWYPQAAFQQPAVSKGVGETRPSPPRSRSLIIGIVAGILLLGVAGLVFALTRNRGGGGYNGETETPAVVDNTVSSKTTVSPVAVAPTPAPTAAVMPATPATPTPDIARSEAEVRAAMSAWAASIKRRDLDGTLRVYADRLDAFYNSSGATKGQVRERLRTRFNLFFSRTDVQLQITSVKFDPSGTVATVEYENTYEWEGGENYLAGKSLDRIRMTRINSRWLITGEQQVRQLVPERRN